MILQSDLEDFVCLENKARRLFRQKLDTLPLGEFAVRMSQAGDLWRGDPEVLVTLAELRIAAKDINGNFLSFTLGDMLKLFYFFIGYHEELFFRIDGSHQLTDLVRKPKGYSFETTSTYLTNRFFEAVEGRDVWENNMRIEMCLAYLFIFNSRVLFSPHIPEEVRNPDCFRDILSQAIGDSINPHISLLEISKEKTLFLTVLEGVKQDIALGVIGREQWMELGSLSLKNLLNMLSIAHYLKTEIYDEEWRLLRPSFFQPCKENWTTQTYMCRIYEGPETSPEFPFKSLVPAEMWLNQ